MSASCTLVEPAYRSGPTWRQTLGPEVADLGRLAGLAPDPEQEMILDAMFGRDASGRSTAFEVAAICSRQNLKTATFKLASLGWLFVEDARLVTWSAHEFRTSQEAFRDMTELIEGCPALSRRLKAIHRANGDESIELVDDRRLIFKARTKGGGRGLTGDKVILDEAFALQPMHVGALLPTLSARPDPQVVYGSSAGMAESMVLRGIRDRGRSGDPHLAYLEWCAPPASEVCAKGDACTHALDEEGCGCDDPANWQLANPAMGRRITVDYIESERRALPPSEFARERMGWWDDPIAGHSPISPTEWSGCIDSDSSALDPVAFALDVSPDGTASIAAAGRRSDGRMHVETIEHRRGMAWVARRLVELKSRHRPVGIWCDPAGPAGSLLTDLHREGIEVELLGAREHAQACGLILDLIRDGQLRHLGTTELTEAIEGAAKRPLGDAWAWSRKSSTVDISPLVAVTFAAWGAEQHAADPADNVW